MNPNHDPKDGKFSSGDGDRSQEHGKPIQHPLAKANAHDVHKSIMQRAEYQRQFNIKHVLAPGEAPEGKLPEKLKPHVVDEKQKAKMAKIYKALKAEQAAKKLGTKN